MDFTKNICNIIFNFFWRFYPYHNQDYYLDRNDLYGVW